VESVLALVDFSGVTEAVVKNAADMAQAFRAQLILLHVSMPDADYEGSKLRTNFSRDGVAGEMQSYHHTLLRMEKQWRDVGIDVKALLVRSTSIRGNPVRKILQEIGRLKPDLIVVGSHGYGLIHDMLLGGVSSTVVRKAPCPILVVPIRKRRQPRKQRS